MAAALLEMHNIGKTFPGVTALQAVNFTVAAGEIHGLVGENGAGKSTLMKILGGVHPRGSYSGEIRFDGRPLAATDGIAVIYQELALVEDMTVYENILLGHELRKGWRIHWRETIRKATEQLRKVGLEVNPAALVKDLGVGQRQLVEIAKALSREVKLLILDEPTAALNEADSDNLLAILDQLRRSGVSSILISHKLNEVLRCADQITVLRDGRTVCTLDAHREELSPELLIKHMVGRDLGELFPRRAAPAGSEPVLELRHWHARTAQRGVLADINLEVRRGEIVGLAGLMGSGRTELARSLFGNPDHYQVSGELRVKGERRQLRHPSQAMAAGLAYASEDRKGNGLILSQDVKENITLANLAQVSRHGVLDRNAEVRIGQQFKEALNIKTPNLEQAVVNLSGGNQQKVSMAKWLFRRPDLLILDEPTRGIDVGAKQELYLIMNGLVAEGMSILLISSELPELLGMCDRIYVLCSGRITGHLGRAEATQESIMQFAVNG